MRDFLLFAAAAAATSTAAIWQSLWPEQVLWSDAIKGGRVERMN